MNKKYELTDETIKTKSGKTLYRIRALRSIYGTIVSKGVLGGFIENERNLSQEGDCWVGGDAQVYDKVRVHVDSC